MVIRPPPGDSSCYIKHEEDIMLVARTVTVAVASGLLLALAGCATTSRANLSNAADNLEYNANTLVRDAHDDAARSDHRPPYERDARALADDAHQFRLAVDDRARDGDVRIAFEHVSRSFHAVRDEVAHSDSLQARRDFGPVTDSYRQLEHDLGIYADGDRQARADYPPLPEDR
jgi:hypothetical protein